MSGRPNNTDVTDLKRELKDYAFTRRSILTYKASIERDKKTLVNLEVQLQGNVKRIDALRDKMDVLRPGNIGFELREICREAETSSEPNNEYLKGLADLQKEQK